MSSSLRILVVTAVSAFVGATAFLTHGWIQFGFGISGDIVEVYLLAFLASIVASLVLVPLLLMVQKVAPAGVRGGIVLGVAILGGILMATLALTQWKHFTLDLPDLVGRAWNVYMYFIAFGLAYGTLWILLVTNRPNR